jgi:hypothetical protein
MENDNKIQNKVVETYAEDMARVIESDQGGLVKKLIHEQEQKELEKSMRSPESARNRIYMLLSSILFLIALGTVVFFASQEDIFTVPVEEQFAPLIFNDKSFFIEVDDLSREKVIESIMTEVRTSTIKDGGLEGIYFTRNKQVIGLREFFGILKSNYVMPANSILHNNFLLGVVQGETKDLFFLLKTRSFQDIFESIRSWEGKMFYDLHGFFGVPINAGTNYLLTKDFDDGIVENKNARILYDKEGRVVLMYVFAGDTSIIIANKTEPVREVIFRLSSSQIKK